MIAERFEADLPATFTFDYPTLSAIAGYLAEHAAPVAGTAADSDNALALTPGAASSALWQDAAAAQAASATELVAVSGRYPGAEPGLEAGGGAAFWAGMRRCADLQGVVPLARWDMDAWYAPDLGPAPRAITARFAAVCAGVDAFDAGAFRLAAAEAQAIDPQVRRVWLWGVRLTS